ncbi:MAG TPA: glycoside hydrolase family 2 TIM barrel-domain containing protein [Phycisphaerae bacterium]|nr:glycoside hydrolase family 2 TIM barrel-domain containing protein [Phycisphaerae bacterium]
MRSFLTVLTIPRIPRCTAWIAGFLLCIATLAGVAHAAPPTAASVPGAQPTVLNLSDTGWRLWLDVDAPWKDDKLYLPDQVELNSLPTNPPTGGWSTLSDSAGIPVTLPGTVEEHYWPRSLNEHPTPKQIVEHNGSYLGVSWWYTHFNAPALAPGERCLIHFRGTRLRAEVYVNQRLVGYNLITELPFTVDATPAIKPGAANQLAIRITNPGGELAWNDTATIKWGNHAIPMSHGFGGVDAGIELWIRGDTSVSDLTIFNTPDPATINAVVQLSSTGSAYHGPVNLSVTRDGNTIASTTIDADIPAGGSATLSRTIQIPAADLWDINHPSLYEADARIPTISHSDRQTTFGCRWFAPVGIGSDAKLLLNGRRIVVKSSISWGFWAPNGLFPDDSAVSREISAVKSLGLNSIQNHRHMPKQVVLDGFDHAGLLRYCEAGAGLYSFTEHPWADDPLPKGPVDTSGYGGEPKTFTARYEMFKVLGMVRAFRSHPSVSLWSLQNEISPDLHNPSIFWMIRRVHEIDPSRTVILKSGVNPNNQVLALPYSDEVLHSDNSGFSGWWDQHTAMDSRGEYIDNMYTSPTDWQYRTDNTKEIVCWGEMATGASPDDHSAVARWYAEREKPGYDRLAAETIRDSYQKFIDTYGFDAAFPTAESLFLGAGNKHYFSAARIFENARISDPVDYIVLSGWESTIIDNHSGMTDALRNLKGNPFELHRAGADELLVVRPRHSVVARGEPIVFDVHLINEHRRQGPQTLSVIVNNSDGKKLLDATDIVAAAGGDTYGQLLKDSYKVATATPGTYTITARLQATTGNADPLDRTEQVLVIDPIPSPISRHVAYVDPSGRIAQLLKDRFKIDAAPLDSITGDFDRILLDSDFSNAATWRSGRQWGPFPVPPSDKSLDSGLFDSQMAGPAGDLLRLPVTNGRAKVELFFGDVRHDPNRTFDVALNGRTVLKNFNPANEPGNVGGFSKAFNVDVDHGQLILSIPKVQQGSAIITALRVTDSNGGVTRRVFRDGKFSDSHGDIWLPAELIDYDFAGALAAALPRVQNGTRAILVTGSDQAAQAAGMALADAGLIDFNGVLTHSGPSWFGSWYFGRKHWLLDGLPGDCVWDWPYQADSGETDGMLLSGHHVEAVVGFAKDHAPEIGLGIATIPVGRGQIVVLCLPGLTRSIEDPSAFHGLHPVTATRLLFNALN